jgi:hypothetical protein
MEVDTDETVLVLRFDHNVIEHLGLKLYQNRPTNVIAEMVSNCWDADAARVWIDLNFDGSSPANSHIVIADDGVGMTLDTIRNAYLVIGLPKRTKENPDARSPGGRHLMGRKGIGKLAPFGIATKIDIVTVAVPPGGTSTRLNWFNLDIGGIREQQQKRANAYYPTPILLEADPADADTIRQHDTGDTIQDFLKRIQTDANGNARPAATGTLVFLRGLTLKRALNPDTIMEAMGRRFTVTLLRSDFTVSVNDSPVTGLAPGSADTRLGGLMELEVDHGETEVHAGVQA